MKRLPVTSQLACHSETFAKYATQVKLYITYIEPLEWFQSVCAAVVLFHIALSQSNYIAASIVNTTSISQSKSLLFGIDSLMHNLYFKGKLEVADFYDNPTLVFPVSCDKFEI